MTFQPLLCEWDGTGFKPLGRYAIEADKVLAIGERMKIAEWAERSTATHNHQFGWLHEAWKQLPEHLADRYPSFEHLRKRALIDAGYYNQMIVDAGSNAAAIRVAHGFMAHDEFCVAVVQGSVVAVRTAKSQSRRVMGKQEFQESKEAILQIVSQMIGVAPAQLQQNTGKAA